MKTNKNQKSYPIPVIVATGVVFGIWALAFLIVKWWFPHAISQTGTGDIFDVVNVLFTGLTFVGLIWTLWVQRQDLKQQAEDQQNERIRSRLWTALPMSLELYREVAPEMHYVSGLQTEIEKLPRSRDVEAVGRLSASGIIVTQAFVRLSVFCDLVLSQPRNGFEEDRRAFGTMMAATIGLDRLPLLVEIGMRTDRLSFMSLIYFLYQYGDLMAGSTDEERTLVTSNMKAFLQRRTDTQNQDVQPS